MPRLTFRTSRYLFDNVFDDTMKGQIEEMVRDVLFEAFPSLDRDERNVELRWAVDDRDLHTNELSVDVMYTVGDHGFDPSTAEPAFTLALRTTIIKVLGTRFFPDGKLVSVDAWILPQQNACWGQWCRAQQQSGEEPD